MPLRSSDLKAECAFYSSSNDEFHPGACLASSKSVKGVCHEHHRVLVNVVHVGVGPISQSDVDLAQACDACIVGFNIKSPPIALSQAATRASIKLFCTVNSYV
ncbi:hypothetical protein HN51_001599 [Arachis hypogaea]|uniref:Uncharacterized protein LOC107491032 isoform X2 n=1 Tax=Arachis duranensis TaxID=130453 RepID=A0A6P5NL55_ARADU|nr:uncharacterized protein LOC107491032 isoform X2 [Arachis duranensis]